MVHLQRSLETFKLLIGSIFAVLFGYTLSAEWTRMIVQISYLAVMLPFVIRVYKKMEIV